MMDEENKRIRAWFWLTNLPGYGYKKLAALRAAVDDVWELYEIEESVGQEKAEEFLRQVFSLSDIKYSDALIQVTTLKNLGIFLMRRTYSIIAEGFRNRTIRRWRL